LNTKKTWQIQDPTTIPEKAEEQYVSSDEILKGAQKATDGEDSMGLLEGIRKYPNAVF
jgi:SP family general alpha glucoside:H+ symporter-like MFS transporter